MSLIDGGYLTFQEHTYSTSIDHDDTIRNTTIRERGNFSISASNDNNRYDSPRTYASTIDHDETIRETTTRERGIFSILDNNDGNRYESPIGKKSVLVHLIFCHEEGRDQLTY